MGAPRTRRIDPRAISAEVAALQVELAYSAARSDIEITGRFTKPGRGGGSHWYETADARGEDAAWIGRAVRYLDLAGYLVRDKKRPTVVRVLNRVSPG